MRAARRNPAATPPLQKNGMRGNVWHEALGKYLRMACPSPATPRQHSAFTTEDTCRCRLVARNQRIPLTNKKKKVACGGRAGPGRRRQKSARGERGRQAGASRPAQTQRSTQAWLSSGAFSFFGTCSHGGGCKGVRGWRLEVGGSRLEVRG